MQANGVKRTVVKSASAPAAVGAYNQAIRTTFEPGSSMLFCSGQIPLDPQSGAMVGGDDVQAQTRQVLDNLCAVLQAAGMDFAHVVRTTIYLVDMNDFAAVNEVYAAYLKGDAPARACVAVSALPKGARVEIDAIAVA